MAHARTIIRDAVTSLLKANVILVPQSQIYQSNIYNWSEDVNSAINVKLNQEELLNREFGTQEMRAIDIEIDVYTQSTSNVDSKLDAICEEIENALGADPSLGINALDSHFVSYSAEYDSDLDQPLAMATLNWRIAYNLDASNVSELI